jgi:hypothetical protein
MIVLWFIFGTITFIMYLFIDGLRQRYISLGEVLFGFFLSMLTGPLFWVFIVCVYLQPKRIPNPFYRK